jgi:hypothetical protein
MTMTTAQQPAAPSAPATTLPPDLAAVPKDALAFVHVRVGDLREGPTAKYLQRAMPPKVLAELHKRLEKTYGLAPGDLERVTFVFLPGGEPQTLVIVQTAKPVQREKVLQALVPGVERDAALDLYAAPGKEVGVRFLSERLLVIGSAAAVRHQAAAPVAAEGPLAGALKAAAGQHHLVAGFHLSPETNAQWRDALRQNRDMRLIFGTAFGALTDLQNGWISLDLGYTTTCKLEMSFASDWAAKRAVRIAHSGILWLQTLCAAGQEDFRTMMMLSMAPMMARMPHSLLDDLGDLGNSRHFRQLLGSLEHALDEATVDLQGTTLRVGAQVKFPTAAFDQLALEMTQWIDLPDDRQQQADKLRQLAIGMHNYHGDFDRLPGHAIYGKDGKPLLSWRVALLPYLNQDQLYRQFHLDEPWDSDHNKKLLAQMPKVFELPDTKAPPGHTYFQVPVTPADYRGRYRTMFLQAPRSQMTLGQITVRDGTSNTIMILEADKAVPWTKPEDFTLPADDKTLPKLGADQTSGKFLVAMGDGSTRTLLSSAPPEAYQHLLRQMLGVMDGMFDDQAAITDLSDLRRQRRGQGRTTFQQVGGYIGETRAIYPMDTMKPPPTAPGYGYDAPYPRPARPAMTRASRVGTAPADTIPSYYGPGATSTGTRVVPTGTTK